MTETTALTIVPAEQSPAARAAALFEQAQAAAAEQVVRLRQAMQEVILLAQEVANGGEVYPGGLRDEARRLAEDLTTRERVVGNIATSAAENRARR